jgi:hypothetical protein
MARGRARSAAAEAPAPAAGAVPYKLVLNQWLLSLFNVKRSKQGRA